MAEDLRTRIEQAGSKLEAARIVLDAVEGLFFKPDQFHVIVIAPDQWRVLRSALSGAPTEGGDDPEPGNATSNRESAGTATPGHPLGDQGVPRCKECGCQTGGNEHCFRHAPYTITPLKDGSWHEDRGGQRKHCWPSPDHAALVARLRLAAEAYAQDRGEIATLCGEAADALSRKDQG